MKISDFFHRVRYPPGNKIISTKTKLRLRFSSGVNAIQRNSKLTSKTVRPITRDHGIHPVPDKWQVSWLAAFYIQNCLPGFPVADILSFLSTFYMHGIWMITFRISFTAYSDEIAQVLPLLPFYLFINRHDRWSAAGP